ncbi:MAG: AhpC/TSA family protein [Prevotella sp.]|jgi:thiol-disulfide isomerase/thioredoxin|nr:AhpC/TSA family protein [Prevotella sp.]
MKKIILFLAAIAIFATSCGEKDAFTIKGKLPNGTYDGQQVYLKTLDENWKDMVTIDTVNVVDGEFVFKGLAKEGSILHFVSLDDAPDYMNRPVPVVVEPGQIEMTLDSVSSVKGTSSNNSYQAYMTKVNAINSEIKAIAEKAKKDTANVQLQADLKKQYKEKNDQSNRETFNFVKENIQNQMGVYYLTRNYYRFSLDQLKELVPAIKDEYKSIARVKKVETLVPALEATAVGQTFSDVKGKTPEGKDASLSDYAGKGKYVLVDFWASWCPPCRAEMPKLVELYKAYKDKDFEIVGISLDRTNDDWKNGIKNLNITWPQVSDLKFWDSEGATTYGISSIPHLMLLDKDGKIIARGLDAEEASEKVAELLK